MDAAEYNRKAWDDIATSQKKWFVPPTQEQIDAARSGKLSIRVTATKDVPQSWLGVLRGRRILCLAAGGGHQGPLFAAAGANVTVLDFSSEQLAIDQRVAEQHGLTLATIQADMRELGQIGPFDLVVNPCSTNFCCNVRQVWSEVFRVLRPGGEFFTGFINPINYLFDAEEMMRGNFVVKHSIPYAESIEESAVGRDQKANPVPVEFGHSLADLIGGQCAAGLHVIDFFEDRWGSRDMLSQRIDVFMATRARKPI